mgnify:CR=1 FL=1
MLALSIALPISIKMSKLYYLIYIKIAVSPHLAAKIEGNPVEKDTVISDYATVQKIMIM